MTMNRRMLMAATAIVWLAAASGATDAVAKPVRLEPRVMLTVQQLERLQAVASEGAAALRVYLWRTRMIYGWTWRDLVAGND